MNAAPPEFVTSVTILSMVVAVLIVNAVANTLHVVANLPRIPTGFITSLVIAYLVVAIQGSAHWYDWVLAFFNACLLFTSAMGATEYVASKTGDKKGMAGGRSFFESWVPGRK